MSQTKAQLIAGTASQDVTFDDATVNSLNGGPLAGTRNRIINGNFDIWQRGTSTATWVAPISNFYWPDRWVFSSAGTGGNGSVSQQAFTAGQTDVPGEPTYFLRWQITSAPSGQTTGSCYVEQRIEDVRTLAGRTATISFYAKGTGTLPNIYLTQTFGSGGSTQVAYTLATNVALNASWTKYTYTVNVGSISGKTIGTNHYVGLTFMVPINSTYTLDLAQVQVEPGTVATPFERRSYGQELALCQRYYYRITRNASVDIRIGVGQAIGTGTGDYMVQYPVTMRDSPTALEQSGTAADYQVLSSNGSFITASAVPTHQTGSLNTATLRVSVASGLTAGNCSFLSLQNTGDGYLAWSAEL